MKRTERITKTAGRNVTAKKTTAKKTTAKKAAGKKTAAKKAGGKKMKAYASFDDYLADQVPKNRRVIAALRVFVRRTAPKLQESVKWGNGCWLDGKAPVAYVYSDTDHVQFGFFRGASLADPSGLLQGKGRYVRHTKVQRKPADIDEKAFGALLRQAAR